MPRKERKKPVRRYFYVECDHLADRGYTRGVEVYKLVTNKYPKFIGGNYRLDSSLIHKDSALRILKNLVDFNTVDVYEGRIFLKDINGN